MKKIIALSISALLLMAGCADQPDDLATLTTKCKPLMDKAAETVNQACNDKLAKAKEEPTDFELSQRCEKYKADAEARAEKETSKDSVSYYIFDRIQYSKKLNTCISVYLVNLQLPDGPLYHLEYYNVLTGQYLKSVTTDMGGHEYDASYELSLQLI